MTAQPPRDKGFWQTLPGIVTAIAGLLTAIAGLLAVLIQLGLLGGSDPASDAGPPPGSTTTTGKPTPTAAAVAKGGWDNATGVLTKNDGGEYRFRAAQLGFCVNGGGGVFFDKERNIAFEKMAKIDVLRSDVALTPNGRTDVNLTLTDGTILTGYIETGCEFILFVDGDRVTVYPDKVKKIEFQRP